VCVFQWVLRTLKEDPFIISGTILIEFVVISVSSSSFWLVFGLNCFLVIFGGFYKLESDDERGIENCGLKVVWGLDGLLHSSNR